MRDRVLATARRGSMRCLLASFVLLALAATTASATYSWTSGVGDFVWEDLDSDGIQDPGEPGIPGVVVTIYDTYGNHLDTTTDENGAYLFFPLPERAYSISVDESTLPEGMIPTLANAGGDDAVDSETNPVSFSLAPDEINLSIDFGYATSCGDCEGGVTQLTLQYNGAEGAFVIVMRGKHESLFDGFLEPGDTFTVYGDGDDGTFGKELKVTVNCSETTGIHTSCSKPIGPGLVVGDFEVVSGLSLYGGFLCPPGTNGEGSLCEDGKPRVLIMRYTGQSCSDSMHSQDPSMVTCEDIAALGTEDVFVVVSDKADLDNRNVKIFFSDVVAIGALVPIDAAVVGMDRLKANTYVHVFSLAGDLLQQGSFHTSCSQPLNIGDRYGSLELVDFILE